MTDLALFPELMPEEQFRAVRLQVHNWGTFSGCNDIPIAEEGFLFVGASGSGKSTLLDAFSQLLIPPRWVDFNAAAHETGGKVKGDRSIVSYVRGAWSELQTDAGVTTQYLREETTASGLALTFRNARRIVTLLQVFWIRGKLNGVGDVKRLYAVVERDVDLKALITGFSESDYDLRRLKLDLGDARCSDLFPPYETAFTALLGIKSSLALKLLHKTQSAKNLGDLNEFLRNFMLDEPRTYASAARLVAELVELEASHRAVVAANAQIRVLSPAQTAFGDMQQAEEGRLRAKLLAEALPAYRESWRANLLTAQAAKLENERRTHEENVRTIQADLVARRSTLADLELRERQSGGDQIAGWEAEKARREQDRDRAMRERGKVEAAARELGEALPPSADEFRTLVEAAAAEEAGAADLKKARDAKIEALIGEEHGIKSELDVLCEEIESLESQRSGIPAVQLRIREKVAAEAGLRTTDLPFAGEFIEVLPEQIAWRGALERALRPLALSILVPSEHFEAVSRVVNGAHWGAHVRLLRTGGAIVEEAGSLSDDSVIRKIRVTDGVHAQWLESVLRRDYDLACVETPEAFAAARRAVTKTGFVKDTHARYDKNDTRAVDDPRAWVLGMDNRAKLAALRAEEEIRRRDLHEKRRAITALKNEEAEASRRLVHCHTLAAASWIDIDPAPILADIHRLEAQIRAVREGNEALRELAKAIEETRIQIAAVEEKLSDAKADLKTADGALTAVRKRLQTLNDAWSTQIAALTDGMRKGLGDRFGARLGEIRLDTLDDLVNMVAREINDEISKLVARVKDMEIRVTTAFDKFRDQFPAESADLGAGLEFAGDYFRLLETLERDRLPDFEAKFRELLRQQSMQNLSQLRQYLTEERRDILQRLELVNESLHVVPFNVTNGRRTFLRITTQERMLPEVVEFRKRIRDALEGAWDVKVEDGEAEKRFAILAELVSSLKDLPENRRYRDTVLDVRRHVDFIGEEVDDDGRQIEVYRSGAGKSGGQRQKLTTTCLAAALRYQLCGDSVSVPTYALVVLDEAFDKADSDFTTLAMNIFRQFGFQMIVATPDKAVTTLEPFIGGACVVHIVERKYSSVLTIPYDGAVHRLVWKAPAESAEPVKEA